jgi:hypothetical protein
MDLVICLERVRVGRSVRRDDSQFAHQNILSLNLGIKNPMFALRIDPSAVAQQSSLCG